MFLRELEFNDGVIINEPDLMTKSRLFTEWSIVLASWALWLVVLRPLLVVFLWALGVRAFYIHMVFLEGISNFDLFLRGGLCVVIICLTIAAWTLYDRLRYAGQYKGVSRGLAENSYMGAFFRMTDQDVRRIKQGKRVDVYFEKGQCICVAVDDQEENVRGFFAPQRLDMHFEEVRRFNVKEKGEW